MIFDWVLIIILAGTVIESVRAQHSSVTFSLLALGLAFVLTGTFATFYTKFFTVPANLSGIVYFLLTYAILYIVITVPTVIISVLLKAVLISVVLIIALQFAPSNIMQTVTGGSKIYGIVGPMAIKIHVQIKPLLGKINLPAIEAWLTNLVINARELKPIIPSIPIVP
jgi:hypothetical protein